MKPFSRFIPLALLLTGGASADLDPRKFKLGPIDLIPGLELVESYSDNLLRQPEALERASLSSSLRPSLSLVTKRDDRVHSLVYQGDFGIYHDSREDDYNDHRLAASLRFRPNSRNRLSIAASWAKDHLARGVGLSEGRSALVRPEPDRFDEVSFDTTWVYGTDTSTLNFELRGGWGELDYLNNRNFTRLHDRSRSGFAGRLVARVSGNTRIFTEYSVKDVDYTHNTDSSTRLDSSEQEVSAGILWKLTDNTYGSLQVGRLEKDFASLRDRSHLSWRGSLHWAPRDYSRFTLTTSRLPFETNGVGDFLITRQIALDWRHDWSSSLSTRARLGFSETEYENSRRADDGFSWSVSVSYDLRRWVRFSLGYSHADRDSNRDSFAFEANVVSATATFSF